MLRVAAFTEEEGLRKVVSWASLELEETTGVGSHDHSANGRLPKSTVVGMQQRKERDSSARINGRRLNQLGFTASPDGEQLLSDEQFRLQWTAAAAECDCDDNGPLRDRVWICGGRFGG